MVCGVSFAFSRRLMPSCSGLVPPPMASAVMMTSQFSLRPETPTARRDAGHEPGLEDHRQGYPGGRRPVAPARPPKGLTVTLWTTALAPDAAYVTRLRHFRGGRVAARILRVAR